jgi:hypothetical protein
MATGSTTPETKDFNSLYKKYQHLFTTDNRRAFAMFGFECGEGWYTIIAQLIDHIDSYIKHKYKDQPFDFQIVQIKEKFGGLRFYIDGGDSEIYELIRFAEELSYKTCEYCGSNEDIFRSKGWVITACLKCATTHDHLKGKEWIRVKD